MANEYLTVEEISQMLSIHPKTIQRYIREGKLSATKIGKSWRVSGHDLSTFLESESYPKASAEPPEEIKTMASSVVDIPVHHRDDAIRIINTLTASANAKPRDLGQSSVHSQYIEREKMVRVTLWGSVRFMAIMMDTLSALIESHPQEE